MARVVCLSLILNLSSIRLISARACRREIRKYFHAHTRKTFTESVLTLFIETGAIYTILWVLFRLLAASIVCLRSISIQVLKNIILLPDLTHTAYVNYAVMIMYQVIVSFSFRMLAFVSLTMALRECIRLLSLSSSHFKSHTSSTSSPIMARALRFKTHVLSLGDHHQDTSTPASLIRRYQLYHQTQAKNWKTVSSWHKVPTLVAVCDQVWGEGRWRNMMHWRRG